MELVAEMVGCGSRAGMRRTSGFMVLGCNGCSLDLGEGNQKWPTNADRNVGRAKTKSLRFFVITYKKHNYILLTLLEITSCMAVAAARDESPSPVASEGLQHADMARPASYIM